MTAFRYTSLLAAGLFALMTGCAAAGSGDGGVESHTGTVRVVGSAPVNVQVVLEVEGGSPMRVVGGLAEEVARATGARVTVRGRVSRSPDPIVEREIEATGYEVVSVNGGPVIVGEVVAVDGHGGARLRMDDGEEMMVTGAPRDFRVGQKVWVQGPRSVTVQSYGTLRP
jgi:hypothetical protein